MMNRELCLKEITAALDKLASKVGSNNAVGFTDVNKVSEDFFSLLLNKIYGLNLVNLNAEQKNHPASDLGDDIKKITIQVSSDSKSGKVKDSVEKFETHELGKRFDRLRIVVIAWKKHPLRKDPTPGKSFFNYKSDILDFSDLVTAVSLLTLEQIEDVRDFLKKELDDYTRIGSTFTVSNEVETIARVIEFLTSNKTTSTGTWIEEPDPEKKIEHRFSEHTDFLKKEIIELLPKYAEARRQVDTTLGLDIVEYEHLRSFLRSKSDDLLSEANNNPKKALASLTDYLEGRISTTGKHYDHMAIRYLVLDELIRCNVFPN